VTGRGACPGCGSAAHRPLGRKNEHVVLQCAGCGVLFTGEQPRPGDLRDLYDHYYDHSQFEVSGVAAASLERLVRSLEPARATGRWLDVGYGEGGLLRVAERHGWRCHGTEVSPAALRYGEGRGWVVAAAASDPRLPEQGFDVVTMIELIEHVTEPDDLLRAAWRWLRPGGVLYLTTPNARSLNGRLLGLSWSVCAPPEHLTLWSARGLGRALARAGFHTRQVRTEGLNPGELLARLRPRCGPQPSRNQTGAALNQALSASPLRRSLKAGINRCLSCLRLGDTLKVRAVRRRSPA
jgi:SAM-dependent methyltransferase